MPELPPRYNIAPGQPLAAVRYDAGRRQRTLGFLRWGLIPHWANEPAVGARLINARAETAGRRPAFRDPFRERRCLIPATGFYEWRGKGKARQPFLVRHREGRPLALAGLWDRWRPPSQEGEDLQTCVVLTTEANELVAPLHDRMPLIVDPAAYESWLDPDLKDPRRLEPLLRPFPAGELVAYPVSPRVNSPEHDEPACAQPLPAGAGEEVQKTLF